MIVVSIERNPEGKVIRFTVKGHAGYDEEGKDIVCAAVSAISYTAVGWFEAEYNPDDDEGKRLFTEKDGLMRWVRPDQTNEETSAREDAVLDAMILGFKQIEYSYGKKYLIVKD